MKSIVLVWLLIVLPIFSFSQNMDSTDTTQNQTITTKTMFDIQRNAIYTENILSYSYERLIPVNNRFALTLKGGFMIWDPIIPIIETATLFGGSKNYFEAGVGAMIANTSEEEGFDFYTLRIAYRYQAQKGFLFKASAIYSPDNFILPWLAFGYSF